MSSSSQSEKVLIRYNHKYIQPAIATPTEKKDDSVSL